MTKQHPPDKVRLHKSFLKKIIKHHFGCQPKNIEFKPAGRTNFVFEAEVSKKKKVIVRMGTSMDKLKDFIKEAWVINKADEKNIPVAKVLEVGKESAPVPYMIQEKLSGEEALHHPNRLDIIFEMGSYTRLIHSIATTGYGSVFDWWKYQRGKNETWKDFLHNEWHMLERMEFLEKFRLLDKKQLSKLDSLVEKITRLRGSPFLNHGDLRLKNVIVNKKGKILAFIDWEHSISSVTPDWDLSIALHDLSIDAKHQFLKGYGIDREKFERSANVIKMFNILNYVPVLEGMMKRRKKIELDLYKLRLNGHLDLFRF